MTLWMDSVRPPASPTIANVEGSGEETPDADPSRFGSPPSPGSQPARRTPSLSRVSRDRSRTPPRGGSSCTDCIVKSTPPAVCARVWIPGTRHDALLECHQEDTSATARHSTAPCEFAQTLSISFISTHSCAQPQPFERTSVIGTSVFAPLDSSSNCDLWSSDLSQATHPVQSRILPAAAPRLCNALGQRRCACWSRMESATLSRSGDASGQVSGFFACWSSFSDGVFLRL